MNIRGFSQRIRQSVNILYAALSLAVAVAIVFLLLAIPRQQQQDNLSESLVTTIGILVGAILAAAALATLAHNAFANANRQSPHCYRAELGSVFERYVKWFSYVIGPVIASYGIVYGILKVIEALK